jgi:hypothetical protein
MRKSERKHFHATVRNTAQHAACNAGMTPKNAREAAKKALETVKFYEALFDLPIEAVSACYSPLEPTCVQDLVWAVDDLLYRIQSGRVSSFSAKQERALRRWVRRHA